MINIETEYDNIYDKYCPAVLHYAISRGVTASLAEDIANETLLRLWDKRDKCFFEDSSLLLTWLFRTADFVIMENARSSPPTEDLDDYTNIISDKDDIEERIENIQYLQYMDEIKRDLSVHDQVVFRLIFVEQKTYPQSAEELKVKEVSLRSSLSRLRKRLRPHMDELFKEK